MPGMQSLTAIADPTRRRIVELLATRDRTAGELVDEFNLSAPAISQHLNVLREAGLVTTRADSLLEFVEKTALLLRRACGGHAGLAEIGFGVHGGRRGVLQLEAKVVHQEADVHVGHGDLELLGQLLLDDGQAVAGGDPGGHGLFLLGRKLHGGMGIVLTSKQTNWAENASDRIPIFCHRHLSESTRPPGENSVTI